MTARPAVRTTLVALAGALLMLLSAAILGRLGRSLIEADEAGHYVNALFIGDWLRAGLPSPMRYALDYYAHFPRLSIGHWPPGWYALESPIFALLRPSPWAAVVATTLIGGCNAALTEWAVRRAGWPRLALAAALGYIALPFVIDQGGYILLDQPLTLICGIAAILWHSATERPSLPRYLLFAAVAALALMIKGNGVLIGLVPFLHIAMTKRWRLLADWRLWLAAVLGLLVVTPWYALTFGIAAKGFNYAPGPAYAWLALSFAFGIVWENITIVGMGLAIAAIGFAIRHRFARPQSWSIAALTIAMVLSPQIVFSAVPASLVMRYLAPMMPWLVALIAIGIGYLCEWRGPFGKLIAALCGGFVVVHALWLDARLDPKADIDAEAIAATVAAHPGLWMTDGRATGEGGVIAAVAWGDREAHRTWLLRASQYLSHTDFMGNGYALSVHSPAEVRALLDRLGVVGVVSIREHHQHAYPHGPLLAGAVAQGFTSERHPFLRREGDYVVSVRIKPIVAHPELLEAKSDNVRGVVKR